MPKRKALKTRKTSRRKNPTSRRRAIVRRAAGALAGLNVKGAVKNAIPMSLGMFGSKLVAKRFGGGADQTDPDSWTWQNYLKMAGGALASGFLVNAIKKGWGQKALEGGISLLIYEVAQNELIQGNETAKSWLGEDEPFIYGDDGRQIPLDDQYRMQLDLPEYSRLPGGMQGSLEPVSHLGDMVAPPTRLGDTRSDLDRRYREMFF